MSLFKKKVLLIDTERANLPELVVYKKELIKKGYVVDVLKEKEITNDILEKYEIIWNFMGVDKKKYKKNQFIIHDYRSASSRFFPRLRDIIKKKINIKPNLRIFLNNLLEEYYSFDDKVPSLTLDMGIDLEKFKFRKCKKNFKFCYLGEINRKRRIDLFLKWYIKSEFRDEKLLLIGNYDEKIYLKYKQYQNILFLGKIEFRYVPEYLSQSEYALNLIPNEFPFNIQTSTKLLEYISMDLKIISSNNKYVSDLLKKHKDLNFFVFNDLNEINEKIISKFKFKNIDMSEYSWERLFNIKLKKIEEFFKEDKNV